MRERVLLEQRAISVASEKLAAKLQTIIAQRLQASREPGHELERIVAELRALGHPLELDANDRQSTFYADRPRRNLALWVHWDNGDRTRATQIEVLWQRM
jgi:hypothetical protein